MHDGGAEAPHDPDAQAGSAEGLQVKDIFNQCKTGADREAHDGGIHQESDAMGAEEVDNDQRFEHLLADRRHVTREAGQIYVEQVQQPAVHIHRGEGRQPTHGDNGQHALQADQLVAVHPDQNKQEDDHG
jgi:hypothetical protein